MNTRSESTKIFDQINNGLMVQPTLLVKEVPLKPFVIKLNEFRVNDAEIHQNTEIIIKLVFAIIFITLLALKIKRRTRSQTF